VDVATVATYDRIAGRFADQWWSTRLSHHMDRFVASLPSTSPRRVLDLGCGPGRDTAWMDELGIGAIGMDASMGMLQEARRRIGDVCVVRGDLVALPFLSGSASGAWMCASLLHLTPDESASALRDVARVLPAGGALFVGVQAGDGTGTKSSPSGDRRFTYWRSAALCACVAAAGFDVVHEETAPVDPATGVSWIGVHGRRAA
jgi:ubiquinone/menaquinone biosynthesis C-methylase UbiE